MGSLWMLLASMAFAAMGVFAKLGAGHFSSLELVFYRSLFGVISLGGLVRLRGWTLASPHTASLSCPSPPPRRSTTPRRCFSPPSPPSCSASAFRSA